LGGWGRIINSFKPETNKQTNKKTPRKEKRNRTEKKWKAGSHMHTMSMGGEVILIDQMGTSDTAAEGHCHLRLNLLQPKHKSPRVVARHLEQPRLKKKKKVQSIP
jgi:hypothetical protein